MEEQVLYPLSGPTPQDLAQDLELRKLTKTRVRAERVREYGYGVAPGDGAVPAWYQPQRAEPHALEMLINWTLSQSSIVRAAVIDYLEDPDHDLKRVVSLIHSIPIAERPSAGTLTDLIRRSLPCDLDQLYELARREHPSRRPEAAVRQIIRNLTRRGSIVIDEFGVYHAQ